jgi:hypothetical protein
MGNVVDLHGRSKSFEDDHELIVDLCRFAEGLLSERQVRKRHRLADSAWKQMGEDDALLEKIEDEKLRRIRDGSTKRELAQKHIVRGPTVLSEIMDDVSASPRHRVDAVKTLDTLAANGPQNAPPMDRFIIQINLGEDVLRFNKSIAINADDIEPNDTNTDTDAVAVAALTKRNND